MAIESFEQRMERACRDGEIPGAVLFASDTEGKLRYGKAFGYRSLKDPSKPDPMPLDATMWLASCSKLVGSIAAMQCVERGLFTLDEDVTRILPELKDVEILTGFETGPNGEDKPILKKNTKTITLRHLLTHSSGIGYDFFNPVLQRFRATQNFTPDINIKAPLLETFTYPLLFEPGEAWEYGIGIDWAGFMVERVNGNISLQAYLEKNMYGLLGITTMTFHPKTNPACLNKLADTSDRAGGRTMFGTVTDPEAKLTHNPNGIWNMETQGCSAGAGVYGAPLDYQKILHSICANDGKLLKPSTVDEMFKPQLSDAARESYMDRRKIAEVNDVMGGHPLGTKLDYGLGGELIMEDLATKRKGTMCWGGYPNLLWFCDRAAGISGIYGSQINPPGDPKTLQLVAKWEKEIYKSAEKAKDY